MAKGLQCLIEDKKIINRIKQSLNNIANSILAADPNKKVTAKDLYNKLRSVGVDIDMESVAALYSEAFAGSIGVYSNYETYDELQAYKAQVMPITSAARQALINAGFGKKQKNGKEILDWVKLMRMSEADIREQVKNAISKSFPRGTDQDLIDAEIQRTFDSLKGEWKQIVSNAVIRAQNTLRNKNKKVTVNQKNAADKLADLYAEGLVSTFKDDYEFALRKAVGVSPDNIVAMKLLDELGKTAHFIAQSPFGSNNHLGVLLQAQADAIIAQAKYKEAGGIFKFAKIVKNLFDFILLKILNNPFNRSENYISGASGSLFSAVTYGRPPSEIRELRKQVKRDIIRNNGENFGDVNNMLTGDISAVKRVGGKISKFLTGNEKNTVTNWWYNQIMGTAALNAVDSYRKVSNTWIRFVSGLEDILISKGIEKKEAHKQLHEQLFGKDENGKGRWEEAQKKALAFIKEANRNGGIPLSEDKQTVARFAADIIKLELVESKLITSDELKGAWEAGYKSAGREMGHVSNNIITEGANHLKTFTGTRIDTAVKEKKYNTAALLMLMDVAVNKILFKFVGGGSNWVVLKLEKGGLGIVSGFAGRAIHADSFGKRKNLSGLNSREISDILYDVQKTYDKFTRGAIGGLTNIAFLLAAKAYMDSGDDEERKKKRRRVLDFLEKHYLVQKAIQKVGFLYMGAYMAKMRQDDIGWNELDSKYKKQPVTAYTQNLLNVNPDYSLLNQGMDALPYFQDPVTKEEYKSQRNKKGNIVKHTRTYKEYLDYQAQKQLQGAEAMGKIAGTWFDFNPLPTQMLKGGIDIANELSGDTPPYERPKYENTGKALGGGYFKSGILDGILKKKEEKK